MKPARYPTPRRAFATTFALFLVVLVAGAMLAVGHLMLADARRATSESIDAQLRQLLDVGAVEALGHAGEERILDSRAVKTALPEELLRQGGSVRIEFQPRGERGALDLRVTVKFAERSASQTLRAGSERGAWRIDDARAD